MGSTVQLLLLGWLLNPTNTKNMVRKVVFQKMFTKRLEGGTGDSAVVSVYAYHMPDLCWIPSIAWSPEYTHIQFLDAQALQCGHGNPPPEKLNSIMSLDPCIELST